MRCLPVVCDGLLELIVVHSLLKVRGESLASVELHAPPGCSLSLGYVLPGSLQSIHSRVDHNMPARCTVHL